MARRGFCCGVCESWNPPAVCASCASHRSLEKCKLLKHLSEDYGALSSRLNLLLVAKRKVDEQRNWRAEHKEYKSKLQERLLVAKRELVKDRSKQEQMQISIDQHSKSLESASAQLTKIKEQGLEQLQSEVQRLHHAVLAAEVSQKRRQVVKQLCKFLPLRCSTAEDAQGQGGNTTTFVYICGARLPTENDLFSLPPNELAASLGYMVHLVNLVAKYISAPILHSAVFAASSSRIWQQRTYWDVRPVSRSEEYPLFLPRKSSQAIEVGLGRSSSDSEFLSLEKPAYFESSDQAMTSVAYVSTNPQKIHDNVQKGVKLLKRSIACILTYGYDLFSLPVPSNLSTYEAFAELLFLLSAKEQRLRPAHPPPPRIANTVGDEFLEQSVVSTSEPLDGIVSGRLIEKNSLRGKLVSSHETSHIGEDYEHLDRFVKPTESMIDGWDMVEHPTLPPPPSHSEDIEHWTRAMFIDATKEPSPLKR